MSSASEAMGPEEPTRFENLMDSPEEILKPRPWLQKFNAWRILIRRNCPAGAGPGAILCSWVGRNCNFNDCPRRNFEEDELVIEAVLKVKALREANKSLRQELKEKNKQLKELKKK